MPGSRSALAAPEAGSLFMQAGPALVGLHGAVVDACAPFLRDALGRAVLRVG